MRSLDIQLIFFTNFIILAISQNENWLCDSIICDYPKKCVLLDQVAQCMVPKASQNSQENTDSSKVRIETSTPINKQSTSATTTVFPTTDPKLATLINLFGAPVPSSNTQSYTFPFTLPMFTTTTEATVNLCTLPPVTGGCNRAKIMWFYDNQSGRCERFSWSGCGNLNRFTSKDQCEKTCAQKILATEHE